jgi:hypothetical protein
MTWIVEHVTNDVKRVPVRFRLWIRRVTLSMAAVLGLFGNVMTIIIIRRLNAKGKTSATDRYYLALAVSDLVVTFTATLNQVSHLHCHTQPGESPSLPLSAR